MRRRLVLAVLLAAAPGLLGAWGPASMPGLLATIAAMAGVAVLVGRSGLGLPPAGPKQWIDLGAWWMGAASLTATGLLSSPEPVFLGSATPGRRAALVAAGFVAAMSVTAVLARR